MPRDLSQLVAGVQELQDFDEKGIVSIAHDLTCADAFFLTKVSVGGHFVQINF